MCKAFDGRSTSIVICSFSWPTAVQNAFDEAMSMQAQVPLRDRPSLPIACATPEVRSRVGGWRFLTPPTTPPTVYLCISSMRVGHIVGGGVPPSPSVTLNTGIKFYLMVVIDAMYTPTCRRSEPLRHALAMRRAFDQM